MDLFIQAMRDHAWLPPDASDDMHNLMEGLLALQTIRLTDDEDNCNQVVQDFRKMADEIRSGAFGKEH
jgi:hypothetical protein